jgi:AbrB family looped-hinge helix DNA binding protein
MEALATTQMSSKGQVVIPEQVRKRLGLRPGAQFVVIGDDDVVILKAIQPPSMSDFDALVRRARRQATAAGMRRSDIREAVSRARRRKCDS